MATSSVSSRSRPISGCSIAIDKSATDAATTNRILATTRIYLALEPDGLRYCKALFREQGGDFVDPIRYRCGSGSGARRAS